MIRKLIIVISVFALCCNDDDIVPGDDCPPPGPDCINVVDNPFLFYVPGDTIDGVVRAQKNTINWSASMFGRTYYLNPNKPIVYEFIAQTFSEQDHYWRESINFQILEHPQAKEYFPRYAFIPQSQIKKDQHVLFTYHMLDDIGDVISDRYYVDTSACDNHFEISFIDTVARYIEGEFTLTFDIDTHGTITLHSPERIKLENARFWCDYDEL